MVAWILQLLKANGIDTGDTLAVSGMGSPHWASGKWVRVESRVISTYFTLVCIVWEWEFSCDIIHVRSKVWHEWTCLWDRNRLRHREQTCGCHEGGSWGEKKWEFGISRCKRLCIGWINNEALQYSTGSCIQYPMINHSGKENEKECVLYTCVCVCV